MPEIKSIEKLIENLAKLPSIGKKTAERMAFSILEMDAEEIEDLQKSITEVKTKIHPCPICGNLTDKEICDICTDESRDRKTIMVVSYPKDVLSFEKSKGYHGLYHVLKGVISVSKGIGPTDLTISELINRVKKENINEVILATNPTLEGETTALYISKVLEKENITITRIAYGLPMGGNLDYTDSLTLEKALEGRRKL